MSEPYTTNDPKPKREKQIPAELGKLDEALGELKLVIGALEEGLEPVLRSPSPTCEENEQDGKSDCGLAGQIADHRRRVEGFVRSARELKDRLEV